MSDVWLPLILTTGALAAGGLYLLSRRPRSVVFADQREERLTRQLARVLGCSLEDALPAVRKEIDLAPHQSDETLVKRAAYHYRQELPEKACPVYRDSSPG
jgi:hypothetical protein